MCTIVPLSTTPPNPVLLHHMEISFDPPLPEPYASPRMWLKGDIILTVAFHRLRFLFRRDRQGGRVQDPRVLDPDVFERVKQCVRHGVGL